MKALLIRHAATSQQAPDAPLTAEGYAQAQALVSELTRLGVGPLYTSPFTRAHQTIAPYATASGQVVTTLDDLRERRLSPVSLPDWQDHMRRSFAEPGYAPAGGESHLDLLARAREALARIEIAGGALPGFVTHGGLSAALFHAVDPSFGFEGWHSLRNPDLFVVTIRIGSVTAFERVELGMHQP